MKRNGPQIDVTDVLLDPMISGERFTVLRRNEIINQYGESTIITTRITAIGSIGPTSPNSLAREEAYQDQAKTISVVTPFLLRGEATDQQGKSFQPDIVLWKNDSFVVKSINDYSQFGAGMIQAECTAIKYVDTPPYTAPTSYSGRLDFSKPRFSSLAGGMWRCR